MFYIILIQLEFLMYRYFCSLFLVRIDIDATQACHSINSDTLPNNKAAVM